MNLQHERVIGLCQQLNLISLPDTYSVQAQEAATKKLSYTDFLEAVLQSEVKTKNNSQSLCTHANGGISCD